MKQLVKYLIMILMVSSTMNYAFAQDTKSDKKVKFEFGLGVNCSGPQQQIADLMKKYGYDDTQKVLFKIFTNKDYITYPNYSDVGFNTYIALSYHVAPASQVGIKLNYSAFGQVSGFSSQYGYLDVKLVSLSIIPVYTFGFKKVVELQAGPALMINSADNINLRSELTNERYTQHSLGLFTGLNLMIWDRRVTFGKIGMNYLLTTDCKMGPYTADSNSNTYQIPESTLNFSYLNIIFAFGFNL
jgi:hypothetical protein